MTFIKSLFLLLVVAMAAPASASVFLPADTGISGVDCTVVAAKEGDKKDDGKEEEEEPDCE